MVKMPIRMLGAREQSPRAKRPMRCSSTYCRRVAAGAAQKSVHHGKPGPDDDAHPGPHNAKTQVTKSTNSHNRTAMSTSPTSEEQKKADAELKAKEAAEQAALPYKWTQTIKDVDLVITIDGKYKGRDLDVKLTKTALKVAIKGQDPIIDVR
jgi:hypothetical protein